MNKQVLAALLTTVVALSFTSQMVSETSVSKLGSQWSAWKATHSKVYQSDSEEAYRFAVFADKTAMIEESNAVETDFTLGHNQFSDLTREEMKALLNGYKKADFANMSEFQGKESYPASYDWRNHGAVTNVKDQGQCGSCWAFGTVGGIEGSYAIATGSLTSFSEQQINSCDKQDGGCNGGDLPTAYSYVNGAGLETEASYPYKSGGGQTKSCKASASKNLIKPGQISGQAVKTNNKDKFLSALAEGPLSICIEADSNVFQNYNSGVLTSSKCGTSLDHCVTAVGYDTSASTPYVIVKNSWGTSWGDRGYIKIGSDSGNKKGTCGIYEEPYHAAYKA